MIKIKGRRNKALLMNVKHKGCTLDQNPMEHQWDNGPCWCCAESWSPRVRPNGRTNVSWPFLGILKSWIDKRHPPLDPFQLSPNCFTTLPTYLAMSSICSTPNSHAVFLVQNKQKKITRVDNTRHIHSCIEPTEAYPTLYEVRHWLQWWLPHSNVW